MDADPPTRRARAREARRLAETLTRDGRPNLSAIGRRLGVSARTVGRLLAAPPEPDAPTVETLRADLLAECRQILEAWRPEATGEQPSAVAARLCLEAVKVAASVGGLHAVKPDRLPPGGHRITVEYVRPTADHARGLDPIEAARDVTPRGGGVASPKRDREAA